MSVHFHVVGFLRSYNLDIVVIWNFVAFAAAADDDKDYGNQDDRTCHGRDNYDEICTILVIGGLFFEFGIRRLVHIGLCFSERGQK